MSPVKIGEDAIDEAVETCYNSFTDFIHNALCFGVAKHEDGTLFVDVPACECQSQVRYHAETVMKAWSKNELINAKLLKVNDEQVGIECAQVVKDTVDQHWNNLDSFMQVFVRDYGSDAKTLIKRINDNRTTIEEYSNDMKNMIRKHAKTAMALTLACPEVRKAF